MKLPWKKRETENKPRHEWAEGRMVAIRPDGMRRSFNVGESMLLDNNDERALFYVGSLAAADSVREHGPGWIWPEDEAQSELGLEPVTELAQVPPPDESIRHDS